MAPVAPFLPEVLYQKLKLKNEPESIHLCEIPASGEELIDYDLERKMAVAQQIVNLTRSLREKSRLKVRQPLRKILIPVLTPQERRDIQLVEGIIKEEINVKAIDFVTDETSEIIKKKAKPNFKVIGKKYGNMTKLAAEEIKKLDNNKITEIEKSHSIVIKIDESDFQIDLEDIEIYSEDIEGWLVASENGVTVALDTQLDDQLIKEGIAREFVNRIQNLRKDSDFEVTDRIEIQFSASEKTSEAILFMKNYISNETLAESIESVDIIEGTTIELNEENLIVKLIKK
jgi:isoleucyl-tRNA synthetase